MISPVISPSDMGTGMEAVQVAMLLQISDRLEQELDRQQVIWDRVDEVVADRRGVPFRRTILEMPGKASMGTGTRRSVIKLPASRFPAVYVMCDRSAPTAEAASMIDSFPFSNPVYVEAMVRSEPFRHDDSSEEVAQEGLVDRRAKRTAQAIVNCIMVDPTLGSVCPSMGPPRVTQTDPFMIQGTRSNDQGRVRCFSLARIDFVGEVYAGFSEASSIASFALPG